MTRAWGEVRDLLGRHDCISAEPIESATNWLSSDVAVVRIRLRAAGITRAEWHPRLDLPDRWQFEVQRQPDGSWRLRSAVTEERAVALCMIAESSVDQADRIFFEAPIDVVRTISHYTVEATEPEQSARFVPLMNHALVLARECGSRTAEALVLQEYGVFSTLKRIPGGVDLGRQGVDVARSSGDPEYLASTLLGLGAVHLINATLEDAVAPLHEAASLVERLDDPVTGLKALYMHGYILSLLNRFFEAGRSIDRLQALSRRLGWREGEEMAAFGKADVLYWLGNLEPAQATWRDAAARALANGNSDHAATAYHNIARVFRQQHKLDLAVKAAQQAVAVCPPGVTGRMVMHTDLALFQIESGDLAGAEKTLLAAKQVRRAAGEVDQADRADLMVAQSKFLIASGKPAEALAMARAAVDHLDTSRESSSAKFQALTAAGRALRALGQRDAAIETLRNAIDVAEVERRHYPGLEEAKISFFERQLAPYRELVDILVERDDTIAEGLRIAEQIKARELLDASAGHGNDLSSGLSEEEREREKVLEGQVTERNRALFGHVDSHDSREEVSALNRARVELAGFRAQMRSKYPRLAQRDVAIPEHLPLVDSDAVEFVIGEKRTIAFIVPAARSGKSIRTVEIPIMRSSLSARIDQYLRSLSGRSFGYRSEARALYDTLIAPLAPFVGGDGPLCIIPDGPLWSLPFHTLVAPDGSHLAEQRPLAFAPSLAILHVQRPQRDGGVTLLAFGNPRVGGTARDTVRIATEDAAIGPLPEAEEEVQAISGLYDVGTVHVGDDATESAFKREASKYRILHLAMHGFVASGAPLYSGLVFSDDNENDGILEAREVAGMKLSADLAVLSACNTGAGQISEGEGVLGLSWAFLAAGCPTTVVSQWKADSAATSRLMIELHRQLRKRRTPAEALRRAQLSLIRSETHWHPYYWAPFIVIGRNHAIAH